MKKIISILLICLITVIIVVTIGFNVGIKYSESTQIAINIGKEFEIKDIKNMAKEVFKGQSILVQTVEIYEDMVQITVKEASDEQISELNTKINEKYDISNELTDLDISHNAQTKLSTIVEPYLWPVTITLVLVIIYAALVNYRLGIWKAAYLSLFNIIAPQILLACIYAVTRIPVNRITAIISIIIYAVSMVFNMVYLGKLRSQKKEENI